MRQSPKRRRVLIVTAAMGSGHLQVSREIADRLNRLGHDARIVDVNALMVGPLGRWIERGYPWLVNRAPWLYDAIFRTCFKAEQHRGERAAVPARLALPRLRRLVADFRPHVVVSTYHIAALAVARLRAGGRLGAPAVTFITTFGVHDLWLHPATDAYLCIADGAAEQVRRRSDAPVIVCGPVVRERFDGGHRTRGDARRVLGLPDVDYVALIVAGSLGMGAVERAYATVAAMPGWLPVAVCGRNGELRDRLQQAGPGVVLGWVEDMATLMSAADVLIDNAGGLSAKEALALGVPVVTFNPIAGHGRDDALAMERLGLTDVIDSAGALIDALQRLAVPSVDRRARIRRGRSLFVGDAAQAILDLVHGRQPGTVLADEVAVTETPNGVG